MEKKAAPLKGLLIATSISEGTTGLALMTVPSTVVKLLFGSTLSDPTSVVITRLAGSALLAFALACWFSRKTENAMGLMSAMLFYNLTSVFLLGFAGAFENLSGMALWPATTLHGVMALWCLKLVFSSKA